MKLTPSLGQTVDCLGKWSAANDRNRLLRAFCAAALIAFACLGTARADKLPVANVIASSDDGNVPANTLDGSLSTRWSASGDGQWIRFDLGSSATVGALKIAWHQGNQRASTFDVQTSDTASNWTTVFSGTSSGSTTALESYDVTDSVKRYVRILGHGNSQNLWNSVAEVEIHNAAVSSTPATPTGRGLTISAARMSNLQRVTLQWPATNGTVSQVQVSSDLRTWANAGTALTNTVTASRTWQEEVSPTAWPKRFYRVKHTQVTTTPTNTTLPTIQKTLAGLQMGSKKVVHYRNRPLDVYDPRVTRAIIVVHGSGANASGYFDRINNVIPSSFKDKVLVIAPHFQDSTEAASDEYWWDGDWREGGASGGISSYAVVDKMVEILRNGNFPYLKWIVVGGHSAGGQFSQRYAAFTDIDMKTTPNSQYVKFVPANPSSYVYLNEYRPDGNGNWIIPQECSSGDKYNTWKYGLDGLYGYTATRGANFARTNLPRRWVELLAGTFDNVVDDGLDTDCAAMRQGERRFDRAQNFNAFMDRYYPNNNFSITMVPEVGHDSTLIFASPQGLNAYFFAD